MPRNATAAATPEPNTRELPMQHIRAEIVRDEQGGEKATRFKVVWTTGATVRRTDWWTGKRYDEELLTSANAVRLNRLNAGASVLDTHNSWELNAVIGAVVPGSALMKDGRGEAEVEIDDGPETAATLRKIRKGLIRHISVGYVVHRYEKTERDDGPDLWRAVDWEPYEISFVPVPADAGAGLRSERQPLYPCEFITPTNPEGKDRTMPTKDTEKTKTAEAKAAEAEAAKTRGQDPEPSPEPTPAPGLSEAERKRIADEERARIVEIGNVCRTLGLSDEFKDKHVKAGTSLDEFRKLALNEKATAQERDQGEFRNHISVTREEVTKVRSAVESALLHRYQPGTYKLEDDARQFRGMSLLEIGRDLLERRGVRTRGKTRAEVAQLALGLDVDGQLSRAGLMGTTDFPYVLANTANKTLRAGYEAMPQTFKPISRQVTLSDFKTKDIVQLGEAARLEKVNESGEYKYGSMPEAREQMALAKYGKIVAITWEAIINDDLDAFTAIPAKMAAQVAQLESDLVWGVVLKNAALGDGVALFDASTHANYTSSGTAISVDSLGVGRKQMRVQKGLDAKTVLNLQPKYLVVAPTKETIAQQYLATERIIMTKASDFNPFAGALQLIVEPRLETNYTNPSDGSSLTGSTTAWYLFADPAVIDTIWYAYLEGESGPMMESRVGFDVDGLQLKIRHVVAAKAIDYRGMYKNAGA